MPEVQQDERGEREVIDCGVAEHASEWDIFYVEWAKESAKRNIPLVNDLFAKLITLTTALVGGSFLAGGSIMPAWAVVVSSMFFIASLAASCFGIYPHASRVLMDCPEQIAIQKREALQSKRNFLAGALVMGLGVALLGVLAKAAS